jgi:orotidine-5'-phosphate decarboxylase
VTVLTSLGPDDLAEIGFARNPDDTALNLARMARDAGLDGVVCSPHEAARLRNALGPGFLLVTPGVRPAGAVADDQARIATPSAAVRAGADYLVVGRPVTRAPDPLAALAAIERELQAG